MSSSPELVVVVVPGRELQIATVHQAMAHVRSLITGAAAHHVVLDLAGIHFMDSSGIGGIIEVRNEMLTAGGSLRVQGMSPRVERTLATLGLLPMLAATE